MSTVKVELLKFHTQGLLRGEQTTETMSFVDWETAVSWAEGINHKDAVPYGVETIRNLETDEVEVFFD